MSNQNKQGRERWVRGESSLVLDGFGRSADRGRAELSSATEAEELMNELDLAYANKFGTSDNDKGAGAGAMKALKRSDGATVRRLSRLYAVAAAILLLVAAGFWWVTNQQTMDGEALYAEAFAPYANELSSRSMGGGDAPASADEQLEAASLAYDRRDYAAAATAFADYLSTAPAAAPSAPHLYYGISLLGTNQVREAIPVFDRLIEEAPSYRDTARWYRALALLRSEQFEAARQALETIANTPSSLFASRAKNLLKAFR